MAGAHGFFKDGINDHVVAGAADAVNPDRSGTKAAALTGWPCRRGARPGCACAWAVAPSGGAFADFDEVMARRRAEADEFYAELQKDIARMPAPSSARPWPA